MADRQTQNCPIQLILPQDAPKSFRPEKSSTVPETTTEQGDHKNTVYKREHSVVHAKERNGESLANPCDGRLRIGQKHLQHIKSTDNDVLTPEERHERKNFPMKKEPHRI